MKAWIIQQGRYVWDGQEWTKEQEKAKVFGSDRAAWREVDSIGEGDNDRVGLKSVEKGERRA